MTEKKNNFRVVYTLAWVSEVDWRCCSSECPFFKRSQDGRRVIRTCVLDAGEPVILTASKKGGGAARRSEQCMKRAARMTEIAERERLDAIFRKIGVI